MAEAIWGWRLEALLGSVIFLVIKVGFLLGPGGPLLLLGLIAIALWQVSRLRWSLKTWLIHSRARRLLVSALRRCQVLGYDHRTPKITATFEIPVGLAFRLKMPPGLHLEALEKRLPEIEAALGIHEGRIQPVLGDASLVDLLVIHYDALAEHVILSPLLEANHFSLWNPVPIGLDENGHPVLIHLPEHNLLIGGEPGAGKSVALASIVVAAALDWETTLTLLDGKRVELALWEPIADRFVGPDLNEAVEALDELRELMDQRYQWLLESKRRKVDPSDDDGLHLLVIDELALYLRGGKKETRERFAESLRDLISRGRAAGIIIVAATQKPSHEVVPTYIRDLFSYRLAMRCTSPEASDTILGQGWASQGFSAASIDPANRGIGYLLAEGGKPIRFKAAFFSDEDLIVLEQRSEFVRAGL
jgi:DNA segregation ATPase FtsK/SpoIIIE-like protein